MWRSIECAIFNDLDLHTYTSTHRCNFEWPWTTLSDLQNFQFISKGASAAYAHKVSVLYVKSTNNSTLTSAEACSITKQLASGLQPQIQIQVFSSVFSTVNSSIVFRCKSFVTNCTTRYYFSPSFVLSWSFKLLYNHVIPQTTAWQAACVQFEYLCSIYRIGMFIKCLLNNNVIVWCLMIS